MEKITLTKKNKPTIDFVRKSPNPEINFSKKRKPPIYITAKK